MFDECAGNFSHKRLRAVIWLVVVIVLFTLIRQFYVSRIDRGPSAVPQAVPQSAAESERQESD